MSSRKDEERTEKIIRGLMKLPPNRRCINCNSLGPQYVCTNFWTFVCMTCSGIHREFTHRVKSVSMSKFTSQEVEALQNGGNQRAREIYLEDWDSQGLRLPDNSNADKIREFITNVYIDKKFVGGRSFERPPRDSQKLRSHKEETRRASSYHSYSQSPPYDFHYEERLSGRHAPVLSRKPGSDRGLYDRKFSSFLSPSRLSDRSPSHFNDHMYEDRFANERSNSRISGYSGSSGGDPFRSGVQSPNCQKDIGSPSSEASRDFSCEDIVNYIGNGYSDSYAGKDAGAVPHPQGTASCGNFRSFDSNSLSSQSINSTSLVNVMPEPEQHVESHCNQTSPFVSLPQSSLPEKSDGLDLFNLPFAPKNVTDKDIPKFHGNSVGLDLFNAPCGPQNVSCTATSTNMSHIPELPSAQSLDSFEPPPILITPTIVSHQLPQTVAPSSLNLFSEKRQLQPTTLFVEKLSNVLVPQNERWATFDMPQQAGPNSLQNSAAARIPSSGDNGMIDPLVSLGQWPSFHYTTAHIPVSIQTAWNEVPEHVKAMTNTSWNAFEDSSEKQPSENVLIRSNLDALHQPSTSDKFLSLSGQEEYNKDRSESAVGHDLHPLPSVSSDISMTPDDLLMPPVMAPGIQSYPLDLKSNNPFELPYNTEIENSNTSQFWDMSLLQAAMPDVPIPSSFTSDADHPWFFQEPMTPCGSEGASGFMTAQPSNLPNVPSRGPVASIGGNPFTW